MTGSLPRRAALAAAMLGAVACAEASGPSPVVAALQAPDSIVVAEFDSARIPLTLLDSSGHLVATAPVVWQIADSTVATIDRTGQLQYRRPGTTTAVAFSHGLTRTVRVTAGVRFTLMASGSEYQSFMRWCGVTLRGTLYCLGSGLSLTIDADTLTRLEAPAARIRQLSVGSAHVCAVTADNAGWCWGINQNGPLGSDTMLGQVVPVMTPVRVQGGLPFLSIDAGGQHSCGVTTGGGIYCWGLHSEGRLGDGDSSYSVLTSPTKVSLPLTAVAVAAGGYVSCALLTDRSAWCWGANDFGGLGIGQYPPRHAWAPMRVASNSSFQSLSAGSDHVCARTAGNNTECWGANTWGQLGTTNDVPCPSLNSGWRCAIQPVTAQTTAAILQVATAGLLDRTYGGVSCGLGTSGEVYCWGANRYGEVGIGTTTQQPIPVRISGPVPPFTSISVGDFHACGLTFDGVAWCWGYMFGLTPKRLPNQY